MLFQLKFNWPKMMIQNGNIDRGSNNNIKIHLLNVPGHNSFRKAVLIFH